MRRPRSCWTIVLALQVSAAPAPAGGEVGPPNIVFIMLDEWGYHEMSGLGHEKIQTPNIDRFAAEGMRFTKALAGAPVCAPSRATLLLGQHTGHTSLRSNGGYEPIRADDITVAQVLKGAGYATSGFGKWGCGGRGTSGVPETHGFDLFFGYYDQRHAHTYYPRYLLRNSEEVPLKGNTGDYYTGSVHAQHVIFNEAMWWLAEHKDERFFLYLPFTVPHGLWGIPENDPAWEVFKDRPWRAGQRRETDARVYAAMLLMVDRQVGELLVMLTEHGIDDDTIVFLCGDNGGQDYFREGGKHPRGFFAPNVDPRTGAEFRGQKGQLYEGGLRVPMLVRWPGHIQPGTVSDHPWYFPDVMPTLAELAGVAAPSATDGLSIVPTLLGRGVQPDHDYLYWEYGTQQAVRMGDWKAVRPRPDATWELYNLATDAGETDNLAAMHPEIVGRAAAIASQAHEPIRPGEVFDRALAEMDHAEGAGG